MPRVASLYLPEFPIERIRRIDAARRREAPPECDAGSLLAALEPRSLGWRPGARWAREEDTTSAVSPVIPAQAGTDGYSSAGRASEPPPMDPGSRRDDGQAADRWMARRHARKAAIKAELEARVERLPLHQRPPMRELGRRSEAAALPFRAGPRDEAGGLCAQDLTLPTPERADGEARHKPVRYDLLGAFWHTGRTVGPQVARGIGPNRAVAPRPAPAPAPGPPLVTALRDGQRMLVAAACPAARRGGIAPGMALAFARALLPGLEVRDADPAGDAADLHRLALFAARRWTPAAAPLGDGLWLELTGTSHLHGGEARFCARVLRFCARLDITARIAVAETHGAAFALARHAPEAVTLCPPDGQANALAPLPLAALRLDPRAAEGLVRLGVETVGALAAMPRAPLSRRFGCGVVARLDQALGAAPEPIEPVVPPPPVSAACRFAEPIGTAEAIADALAHLVPALVASLAAQGVGARAITLRCGRVDRRDETVAVGTARPSRDARHLLRLLTARIETIDPGFGIEAMRLVATATEPLPPRPIGDAVARAKPDLAELVDLLAVRLGARRLYRMREVESDLPERSAARAAPHFDLASLDPHRPAPPPGLPQHILDGRPGGGAGVAAQGSGDAQHRWNGCEGRYGALWQSDWPRPIRLLDPPEPVEHVVAELPDHPPRRFRWRGQLHAVAHADGPERIHAEWWRTPAQADAVRDYFAVEDEAGSRFWLFRCGDGQDARTGDLSWRVHGLFG